MKKKQYMEEARDMSIALTLLINMQGEVLSRLATMDAKATSDRQSIQNMESKFSSSQFHLFPKTYLYLYKIINLNTKSI